MKAAAPGLSQHGRAGVDALGAIQKQAAAILRLAARDAFYADPAAEELAASTPNADDRPAIIAWVAAARTLAETITVHRLERFFQAYVAQAIYSFGIPAVEERRALILKALAGTYTAPHEDFGLSPVTPDYYVVDWHLRPGGWDGYDLYGPHGRLVVAPIFRLGGFAAVPVGSDIGRHRRDVAAALPQATYARIYEPGCGAGSTLIALHQTYPDSELIGSDLSIEQLQAAAAASARAGFAPKLRRTDAVRDSGESEASVDAVITFALHHELPPEVNRRLLSEMHRILRPGGDIILADPPPFVAVDPYHAAILDWETEHREEPYFSEACASDFGGMLSALGFTDVRAFPLGPEKYPWVTLASKPVVPQ